MYSIERLKTHLKYLIVSFKWIESHAGFFQGFSSIGLFLLAVYGIWFSELSDKIHSNLNAELALEKMDLADLRREKKDLQNEINSSTEQLKQSKQQMLEVTQYLNNATIELKKILINQLAQEWDKEFSDLEMKDSTLRVLRDYVIQEQKTDEIFDNCTDIDRNKCLEKVQKYRESHPIEDSKASLELSLMQWNRDSPKSINSIIAAFTMSPAMSCLDAVNLGYDKIDFSSMPPYLQNKVKDTYSKYVNKQIKPLKQSVIVVYDKDLGLETIEGLSIKALENLKVCEDKKNHLLDALKNL